MKNYFALLSLSLLSPLYFMCGYAATVITTLPFTITQPGAYVLGKNLTYAGTSNAITVDASNVLIDLKGFSIPFSGTTGMSGIVVSSSSSNVTIQNGAVFNFFINISLDGPEATIQNLRLETGETGGGGTSVWAFPGATSCIIQNCFIAGNGNQDDGITVQQCSDVLVKNNHIVAEARGIISSSNNWIVSNYVDSCAIGLSLSPNDKYQGNVTTLCTTPFTGGIAVGTGNN